MNQINVIYPYRHNSYWVFDDAAVGLIKEPFVGGADTIIDTLTAHIPHAHAGFSLVFSANDFKGSQTAIEWLRHENGGDTYLHRDSKLEGWLCPALLRYFSYAPAHIFIKVRPMPQKATR